MPRSADVLSWSTLTASINEMKAPQSFLKNRVFRRDVMVPTRDIELSVLRRGRRVAPFVKRNGAALMTVGGTEEFKNVRPAHIRIKRPITSGELVEKRRAGSSIFPGQDGVQAAIREFMAREQGMLLDDVTNAEEYLAAQAIRGSISYSNLDEESFEVDFGRSASHDITLTGTDLWTDAASKPQEQFLDASRLINDDVSLMPDLCLLGEAAADAFLKNAEVKDLLRGFNNNLVLGSIDLTQQFQESGAMFLGTFVHGIQVWTYGRSLTLPDGSSFPLIRTDRAEFISTSASAQHTTYYGAIEDVQLFEGRLLMARRFSKSWIEQDPPARQLLVESNPLPCMRRPDSTVSIKVV